MSTMEELSEHIVYLRDVEGSNWTEIGNIYRIDRRTAKRLYEKAQTSTNMTLLSEGPLFNTDRFQPFVASGDMIVTCDWHVPLYDPKMVNSVIKKAHEHGITKLVIGGDYWDMTSISHYPPHQREAPFEKEQDAGVEIADALTDTFDSIDMFWGNHDWRFMRTMDYKISFQLGMKMLLQRIGDEKLAKFNFSELDYMYLEQDKEFRFSHQKNFSVVPLKVPRELATKYRCSIIAAHSHHCAIGVAQDGENLLIEGGGLFDKTITEYVQKTTTHHEWVQGFTMFKDGIPTVFSPTFGNI